MKPSRELYDLIKKQVAVDRREAILSRFARLDANEKALRDAFQKVDDAVGGVLKVTTKILDYLNSS